MYVCVIKIPCVCERVSEVIFLCFLPFVAFLGGFVVKGLMGNTVLVWFGLFHPPTPALNVTPCSLLFLFFYDHVSSIKETVWTISRGPSKGQGSGPLHVLFLVIDCTKSHRIRVCCTALLNPPIRSLSMKTFNVNNIDVHVHACYRLHGDELYSTVIPGCFHVRSVEAGFRIEPWSSSSSSVRFPW